MLRFGIRGHDVPVNGNFEEWVKSISDQGFCCTQLALKKAVKDFYVGPDAMTPGMALYMRNIFAKYNVDVAVLGCYLNVTTPDLEQWEQIKKNYEAHFRFASLLGCGMVGTETGAMNKEYKQCPENRTPEALNILIERLKILTESAEKYGVNFGIEPVCRHNMYTVERTRKVLDAVKSPNLRVILDLVNLLEPANYKQQGEILADAIATLNDEIDCLHFKDFTPGEEALNTKNLALGDGELMLEELLKYAKAKKPCIHILLEDSNPSNCQISKARVEEIYKNIII